MNSTIQKKENISGGRVWLAKVMVLCVVSILFCVLIQPTVISAAKLSVNKKTADIYVGKSVKLKTNKKAVKWSSSNTAVATVSKKGKVKGVSVGTTTITATKGKKKVTCEVTVNPRQFYFNNYYMNAYVGESGTPLLVAQPAVKNVKWSSSDKSVAKVDKNGVVKAVKEGTATITATADGMQTSMYISVGENPYYFEKPSYVVFTDENISVKMGEDIYDSITYSLSLDEAGTIPLGEDGPADISNGYTNAYLYGEKDGIVYLKGTVKKYSTLQQKDIEYTDSCKIYVCSKGITEQDVVLAEGTTHSLQLKNIEGRADWISADQNIAVVDSVTGVVTGVKAGSTVISVNVLNEDGNIEKYETNVTVSSPKINKASITVAKSGTRELIVKGRKDGSSKVEWSSSNTSIVSVNEKGNITAYKKGTATISAVADGKTLTSTVIVTEPKLSTTSVMIPVGKSKTIKIKGLHETSTVKITSPNKKIAKVSSDGVITAKKKGSVYITVSVDGMDYSCYVGVADKRAIAAVKKAKKIISSSTYSQAKRMQNGYYDCSALVWKGYGKYGYLLGDKYYAPVAANQAKYLEQKKKVVSFDGYIDESQLAPGDLIFYGNEQYGSKDRYKYIYHVSMYCGDGLMIEKPLRSYLFNQGSIVLIARPM